MPRVTARKARLGGYFTTLRKPIQPEGYAIKVPESSCDPDHHKKGQQSETRPEGHLRSPMSMSLK